MKLIGVTGGVGMGKSTSAAILRERGFPLVDTDEVSREIVEPGRPALKEIQRVFGESVIDPSGRLRREMLAHIVFASEDRRKELEAITHPIIRAIWQAKSDAWRQRGELVGFVVIPLLFEIRAEKEFDHIVCVACNPATQRNRLSLRGWSPDEAERRIRAQWPMDKKISGSDFVVWTEGDLEAHRQQWDKILASLSLPLRKTA